LKGEITEVLAQHYHAEGEEAVLYNLHEDLKDLISKYNESVKGRCYICLDQLCEDQEASFVERPELVRIDACYHRFHLVCLYRDWFMKRKDEKDEYGGVIEYKLSESKKCPICRHVVDM
jgi:hypothetical protein